MSRIKQQIFLLGAIMMISIGITAQNTGFKNTTNKMHISSFSVFKPNPKVDEGRWTAKVSNDNLCIQFSDMGSDNPSYLILTCFLLNEFEETPSTNGEFQLKRLAGTMYFGENLFSNNPSGNFKFVRDKEFVSFLEKEGIDTSDEIYYFKLFLGDISKSYIAGIKEMGYSPTIREIGRLAYHDVNLDYLKNMSTNLRNEVSLDMISKLAAHHVTVHYVESLREVGYGNVEPEMIKKLAVHDIDATYIKSLQELGFKNITSNTLKRAKVHGLTPGFVQRAKKKGSEYDDLEDYIKLKKYDKRGTK